MKNFLVLLSLLSLTWTIGAQEEIQPEAKPIKLPTEKIKFSLDAGTSFMYAPKFASGTSFFVTPKFTYAITPKFHLNAGVMILKQNLYFPNGITTFNENQPQSVVIKNSSSVQGVLFAQGDYLLSDRLTLSGSVMKSLDNTNKLQNLPWNNSFQAMSMGVNYKISNTISVGAGVHVIQSNGSFYPGSLFSSSGNQLNYRGF